MNKASKKVRKIRASTINKLTSQISFNEFKKKAKKYDESIKDFLRSFWDLMSNKDKMNKEDYNCFKHRLISAGVLFRVLNENRSTLYTKKFADYILEKHKLPSASISLKEHSNTRERVVFKKMVEVYDNGGMDEVYKKYLEIWYTYGFYVSMMRFEDGEKNTNSLLSKLMSIDKLNFIDCYQKVKSSPLGFFEQDFEVEDGELKFVKVPWANLQAYLESIGRGVL